MAEARASRRGRPRAGEREERERRVLTAALDELVEHGYERVTMGAIAARAGASKETLYKWFGSKEGLFGALITINADESASRVQAALDADDDWRDTLLAYAVGLLGLLTSPASLALNRAAMSSPELASALLEHGRHRIGPVVETYLGRLADRGELAISDPAEAFQLLYGLVVRDVQIRVLLWERPPSNVEIAAQASSAIDRFVALTRP